MQHLSLSFNTLFLSNPSHVVNPQLDEILFNLSVCATVFKPSPPGPLLHHRQIIIPDSLHHLGEDGHGGHQAGHAAG